MLRAGGADAMVAGRRWTPAAASPRCSAIRQRIATLQLKAPCAARVAPNSAHHACHARYAAAFGGELSALGYGDEHGARPDCTDGGWRSGGAALHPEIVFDQTPGPAAGRVLAAA